MRIVSEVLQALDPTKLEMIFSKLPCIFNIVIFSPHGYFRQADVLRLPDTDGQGVYILDWGRALEEELLQRIKQQGLVFKPQILVVTYKGITKKYNKLSSYISLFLIVCKIQVTKLIPDAWGTKCNHEMEQIFNTKHSHILRVLFKTEKGVLRQWISRFNIYPYLDRFSQAFFYSLSFVNLLFYVKTNFDSLFNSLYFWESL